MLLCYVASLLQLKAQVRFKSVIPTRDVYTSLFQLAYMLSKVFGFSGLFYLNIIAKQIGPNEM